MSRAVKSCLGMLKALCKMNSEQRAAILKNCDKSLVQAICECILNVLKGNKQLKSCHKRRISRYKKILRKIIKRDGCWKKKRRIIVQKGSGFLPRCYGKISEQTRFAPHFTYRRGNEIYIAYLEHSRQ
ncbi:hypothetical protein J437_LFUL018584 [Ladona fulva]|uniref:Uncharacterized protein n=1 Tax=Ladona fulva TaxID=123851 RepID=A0A8K0KPC1_LADFU|nr:hypothetical protein J437_LFUL018584 [Ladona fulva]